MNVSHRRLGGNLRIASVIGVLFVTSSAFAAPILNPANGHWYDTVDFARLNEFSWTQSKTLAEGDNGYLLTVTSAGEETFVESFVGYGAWWAGGSDAASEGSWKWMTGPDVGDSFSYTKWFGGEPNNSGNEDYLSWNNNGSGVSPGTSKPTTCGHFKTDSHVNVQCSVTFSL
ncbi:MAG: hypothetical protein CMJ48_06970, partial [Planctomycetaceae bacterium]|nr:hypothetical protein [Planctomycetaceae bacterium]